MRTLGSLHFALVMFVGGVINRGDKAEQVARLRWTGGRRVTRRTGSMTGKEKWSGRSEIDPQTCCGRQRRVGGEHRQGSKRKWHRLDVTDKGGVRLDCKLKWCHLCLKLFS